MVDMNAAMASSPMTALAGLPDDSGLGEYAPQEPTYTNAPEPISAAKARLVRKIDEINLADGMDEDELKKIGCRVVDDWMIDEESRKEWLERNKLAIELANQLRTQKTFPWNGAANVKLPIIADAAIKFAARAYGEIVKDDKVVKGKVIGPDPQGAKQQQADRVSAFMSWQLMENMCEWEDDTDRLLHILPVAGHLFRKCFYDPRLKRNKTELVLADKLCINNAAANLESSRRITHILDNTHKNTVVSNQRAGVWLDVDLDKLSHENNNEEPDTEKYYCFLEQHKWLDLDNDGFEEPYIVTVEKDSRQVMRIVARYEEDGIRTNLKGQIMDIDPCQYFADYKFIPSFDGGYYYVGFGALLAPLNETANSLFNMLLDAGVMANTGGGWLSKEIKLNGGVYSFAPNEWKKTQATAEQLSKGVMPLPVREPSAVLFQLLGMVMELCDNLSSAKDILSGDAPGANTPATTTMALIAEAKQALNAIYKRIYRSMKGEFKILFDLNARYMDEEEYYKVLDEDAKVYRDDFDKTSCDVIPMADPVMSSDIQRMAQADALGTFIGQPNINPQPIQKARLKALRLSPEQIEEICPEVDPNAPPPPNPDMLKLQQTAETETAKAQLKEQELDLKGRELDLKEAETEARIANLMTGALLNLANAEAAEVGTQLQEHQAELGTIIEGIKHNQFERQQALAERQAAAQEQQAAQAAQETPAP
jgi:chaperonin GroES